MNNNITTICVFCLLFLLITLTAQETKTAVLIIPIKFENGQWSTNPDSIKILPCEPPSSLPPGTEKDPLIKLTGKDNSIIYQQHIMDPRFTLPEDPQGEYKLLDYVSFNLRLPLKSGVEKFEFVFDSKKDKEPVVSADLRKSVSKFQSRVDEGQKFPCEEMKYVPDQRAKDK